MPENASDKSKQDKNGGVNFFYHFEPKLIKPYGVGFNQLTNSLLASRMKLFTAEHLVRPGVVTSEFAETFEQNIPLFISQYLTSIVSFNTFRHTHANNINTFFVRSEFVSRKSLHFHLLIWLKKLNNVDISHFSADIPIEIFFPSSCIVTAS